MPKSPISYVMHFSSKKLKSELEDLPQGSFLSDEKVSKLTQDEMLEYLKYLDWVHMPKRCTQ